VALGSISSKLWVAIGIVALVCYCWLAAQVYISHSDPGAVRERSWPYAWMAGPSSGDLMEAADSSIQFAFELLNDRRLPPADRLGRCRDELRKAEALLLRSLRARPADARALARLAAVRWELSPPLTEQERGEHLRMIALASTMAPTAPMVQMQLGELILKMGRRREAVDYFAKTVTLNPDFSGEAIDILRENLFGAEEIYGALPNHSSVLTALQRPYFEEDRAIEYVRLLEEAMRDRPDRITRPLLSSYGHGCLKTGQAERLRETINALPAEQGVEIEAAMLEQLSRASLALEQPRLALAEARQAVEKLPEAAYLSRHLGEVAMAAGEPQAALEALRRSLRILSRDGAAPPVRAQLYRMIGEAEELRGDPGRAYDAYRIALDLDPEESHAGKRVAEMEEAAGPPFP
jgi:tetratricopeptide (TPR) repeat protein